MATRSIATPLLSCTLALCLLPALVQADTFVCTAGDVGCVIASVAKSNANGPEHDYLFLRAGTYMFTRADNDPGEGANGLPVITGALTIVGAGQGVTLLAREEGAPLFRLFEVAPTGGFTLAYVTLQGGALDLRFHVRGGCIQNHGSFMLYHSTVRDCAARFGGGLAGQGEQTLFHATVIDNYAEDDWGGCVFGGTTHIESSWIGNNVAWATGGCFVAATTPSTITRSVFYQNFTHSGNGGGLSTAGSVTITQSLFLENASELRGGGMSAEAGTLIMSNSTLWDNFARIEGGGMDVNRTTAHLRGVAVLFNEAGTASVGAGQGGGLSTGSQGTIELERTWLLWNTAPTGAQCVGNVTVKPGSWAVIGDAGRFHPADQPPCD